MTDVLIQFIQDYVQKHPPQSPKRGQKEWRQKRARDGVKGRAFLTLDFT